MNDLLTGNEPPVNLAQQIACVRREIAMRENVYKRRVADGKMTQAKADGEVRAMQAVLATLQAVEDNAPTIERLKGALRQGAEFLEIDAADVAQGDEDYAADMRSTANYLRAAADA